MQFGYKFALDSKDHAWYVFMAGRNHIKCLIIASHTPPLASGILSMASSSDKDCSLYDQSSHLRS